jgi:hypothetical protein
MGGFILTITSTPISVIRNSQIRSISSAGQPWNVESVMLRLSAVG